MRKTEREREVNKVLLLSFLKRKKLMRNINRSKQGRLKKSNCSLLNFFRTAVYKVQIAIMITNHPIGEGFGGRKRPLI